MSASSASRTHRSGTHDRRGFDMFIQITFLEVFISFLVMIFYSWKIGLTSLMLMCIQFISLECVSRPPINNPEYYKMWSKKQLSDKRCPVLLCLGDSLTHGQMSANFTPDVPIRLASALGLEIPSYGPIFNNPIWVVNAGQNGLTSYTVLHERLSRAMNVHPDYILLMIGTNDVLCSVKINGWFIRRMNDTLPPGEPNVTAYERNIRSIIKYIREASPKAELGVCTLPPIGDDLNSIPNQCVRQYNAVIERVVADVKNDRTTLVPIYAGLETVLEKKKKKRSRKGTSPYLCTFVGAWMYPMYHMLGIFNITWNALSWVVGNVLSSDGIHLNETASGVIVELVVNWLKIRNITKSIAIKSR